MQRRFILLWVQPPRQFRARLICERNVGAGRLGVPVIRITVALTRAAEIRVELCLKHRARNCDQSGGVEGAQPYSPYHRFAATLRRQEHIKNRAASAPKSPKHPSTNGTKAMPTLAFSLELGLLNCGFQHVTCHMTPMSDHASKIFWTYQITSE